MYTPTDWKDGDVITSERLNKLEQGVQNEQVGPKGDTGLTGPAGEKGDAGANGKDAVITPGSAVADAAEGADAAALRTTVNALLASLRKAGLLAEA